MQIRWKKCDELIEINKGKTIQIFLAKQIYKLSKGGYKILELRLSDILSLVTIQKVGIDEYTEFEFPKFSFLVTGRFRKKLSMCD